MAQVAVLAVVVQAKMQALLVGQELLIKVLQVAQVETPLTQVEVVEVLEQLALIEKQEVV